MNCFPGFPACWAPPFLGEDECDRDQPDSFVNSQMRTGTVLESSLGGAIQISEAARTFCAFEGMEKVTFQTLFHGNVFTTSDDIGTCWINFPLGDNRLEWEGRYICGLDTPLEIRVLTAPVNLIRIVADFAYRVPTLSQTLSERLQGLFPSAAFCIYLDSFSTTTATERWKKRGVRRARSNKAPYRALSTSSPLLSDSGPADISGMKKKNSAKKEF